MQYGIGYTFNLRSFQNRSVPAFYINKTENFFHAKYVKGFNQSIDAINSDVSYKYKLQGGLCITTNVANAKFLNALSMRMRLN